MIFSFAALIFAAVPLLASVLAVLRERGEDWRFTGDKLEYRS